MIRARLAELQLAVMLLTRLPAGRLPEPAPAIGAAVWAFPLAGLGPGLIGAVLLAAALCLGVPAPLAAGLALGAQIVVTGALHEDGLADVADGFWGGRDRARRLEIMRDSTIGSYGAVALILSLGLRWQALAILARADAPLLAPLVLLVCAVASRLAPAALMALLPPARADGMGHAARAAPPLRLLLALPPGLLPLLCLPGGAAAAGLAAAAVLALAVLARAKIGGQSGDVLGAAQQLAEITLLLVLASSLAAPLP